MPVVALAPGRGAWIHPQVCLTPTQTRAATSPEVCADCDLCSEPSGTHPPSMWQPLQASVPGSMQQPLQSWSQDAVTGCLCWTGCLFNHCAMPEAAGVSVKLSCPPSLALSSACH